MAGRGTMSRDEHRRKMELEEARKAGLAPAEKDEDGRDINPHIPQYMSAAPWYLNATAPSLKHQKDWRTTVASNEWYDRGAKTHQATKYRKGACKNCGAMSHKEKDCTERPRKRGAVLTGSAIAADEKVQGGFQLSFEGKRDRYNGYDPAMYAEEVVERFEKVAAKKEELQKEEELRALEARLKDGDGEGNAGPGDEEKISESQSASFDQVVKRVRSAGGGNSMSVRNLRIREDTAKYLLNLDTESAHYDPKTRSMREDPTPHIDPSKKSFAGDNFVRKTGDAMALAMMDRHAWEASEHGQTIHTQALPSQAEALFKEFKRKKEALANSSKNSVLEKYGNAAATADAAPDGLLLGQTEAYVEYDRAGRQIRGAAVAVPCSRWEEDVYINNHTSVWGSWWCKGEWGYACCRSTQKQSYCTGKAGIAAAEATAELMHANVERKEAQDAARAAAPAELVAAPNRAGWGDAEVGEDVELDSKKLKKALRKEEKRLAEEETDERKRGFNSISQQNDEVTAEEMEAYRLKRQRGDDPMAKGGGTAGYDLV